MPSLAAALVKLRSRATVGKETRSLRYWFAAFMRHSHKTMQIMATYHSKCALDYSQQRTEPEWLTLERKYDGYQA